MLLTILGFNITSVSKHFISATLLTKPHVESNILRGNNSLNIQSKVRYRDQTSFNKDPILQRVKTYLPEETLNRFIFFKYP